MAKFLVIRFSSIGDIVLTTPILRHLKNQVVDGAEVHYLSKKKYASLLKSNPYIDKLYLIEESTHEVRQEIKDENFDFIIDLHNNVRSRVIKKKTKVLDFTFKKYNWEKWLWVNFNKNKMPDQHIVDRYMETIHPFDVSYDGQGLDYFIPSSDEIQMHGVYIAWAIGAAHVGKKFSREKLMELLPLIDHPIKLIGGQEDEQLGKELANKFDHIENYSGSLNVNQSASIIKQAKLLVTPDTGMMHIGAALKKNIVSYWGCTHPGLGMYPFLDKQNYKLVMPEGGRDKPCSKLGDRCKVDKNNPCPNHINAQELIEAINHFLN